MLWFLLCLVGAFMGLVLFQKVRVGDIVAKYDCRGCMASDHQLMWIGEVTGYVNKPCYGLPGLRKFAIVQIVKQDHRDIRDVRLDRVFMLIEDKAVQRLAKNFIAWYT